MNPGGLKGAPLLKIREEGGTGRKSGTGWQEVPTTAVAGRSFRVETYRARGQTLCQPGRDALVSTGAEAPDYVGGTAGDTHRESE